MARVHTTAHGLTMDWSVNINHRQIPILRGYIDREQRFACELSRRWTLDQAERLVAERLRQIQAADGTPA